jgi:hypothetical protein
LRAASPARKAAMLLSLWVAWVNVESVLELKDDLEPPRLSDPRSAGKILANNANLHTAGVVELLAGRTDPRPVVLRLDDSDPRGHTAAFYAYPRLILMEPAERRWGLRERMLRVVETETPRAPRPPVSESRDFAARRGGVLVIAGPDDVHIDAGPEQAEH